MLYRLALTGLVSLAVALSAISPSTAHATSTSTARAVIQELVQMTNADRAQHHRKPLALDSLQSKCSLRHARHMALQGKISHDQFPGDICIPYNFSGENVGVASGDPLVAAAQIHQMMMAEGPCPDAGCPKNEFEQHGHYLNLINREFTRIGIGVFIANGAVWIAEDFTDGKSGS